MGKMPKVLTGKSGKEKQDMTKNVVADVADLEVAPEVVAGPLLQVLVRLNSLSFCYGELGKFRGKLLGEVNVGDDVDAPTSRYGHARMVAQSKIEDIDECLHQRGQELAAYLANRLVFFELRKELFEQLYFVPGVG